MFSDPFSRTLKLCNSVLREMTFWWWRRFLCRFYRLAAADYFTGHGMCRFIIYFSLFFFGRSLFHITILKRIAFHVCRVSIPPPSITCAEYTTPPPGPGSTIFDRERFRNQCLESIGYARGTCARNNIRTKSTRLNCWIKIERSQSRIACDFSIAKKDSRIEFFEEKVFSLLL